jgi:hypothetical protein
VTADHDAVSLDANHFHCCTGFKEFTFRDDIHPFMIETGNSGRP